MLKRKQAPFGFIERIESFRLQAHTVLSTLLFTGCLAASLCHGASLEQLRFKRLLAGELSEHTVRFGAVQAIEKDADGFMWFGSEYGLARYDSHEFTFYYSDTHSTKALSSNYIYDLHKDKFGNLWIATNNGLNRYLPERGEFQHFFHESFEFNTIASNIVRKIAEYNDGTLVFATPSGLSLLRPHNPAFYHYRHKPSDPKSLSSNDINTVFVDSKDRLWIGTSNSGLNRLDPNTQSFKKWTHLDGLDHSLPNNGIQKIAEDAQGRIWIASHRGHLSRLNEDDQTFTHHFDGHSDSQQLAPNSISDLYADPKGRFWVATDHSGLALYDELEDTFNVFRHNPHDLSTLNTNQLRSVFGDEKGNLWVGNFPTGINFYDHSKGAVRTLTHLPNDLNTLSHNAILSLHQDSQDAIWIGTESGLNLFDPVSGRIQRIKNTSDNTQNSNTDIVVSIDEDSQGNLWVGYWSGGLHRLNPSTQMLERVEPAPGQEAISDFVWQLRVDHRDHLWITTTDDSGLFHFNPKDGALKRYVHDPDNPASIASNSAYALEIDSNQQVWVGSTHGLNVFKPDIQKFQHFPSTPAHPNFVAKENVTAILEDKRGRIWVGTYEGHLSLYDPKTQQFTHLNIESFVRGGRISSILEDNAQNIWVGTSNGLIQLTPNAHTKLFLSKSDGLAGSNHNRNAALIGSNGLMYFGSTEGLSIFDPTRIHPNDDLPKVKITQLSVDSQKIQPEDGSNILDKSIEHSEQITLLPKHLMFSLKFSALNFVSSNHSQFKYKLEGFDKLWHNADSSRTATYTNIPPGEYTFRVIASTQQGMWGGNERQLKIKILSPTWLSTWAKSLYVLLCGVLIWVISKQLKRQSRSVHRTPSAIMGIDNTMFTDTVIEVKTQLQHLAQKGELSVENLKAGKLIQAQQDLETVVADSDRLASLLNQMLEQAQIEANKLQLTKSSVSLFEAVQAACNSAHRLAQIHQVAFKNAVSLNTPALFTDKTRLKQILLNLIDTLIPLSSGHTVIIAARKLEKHVEIEISTDATPSPEPTDELNFAAMLSLSVSQTLVQHLGGELNCIRSQQPLRYVFTQAIDLDRQETSPSSVMHVHHNPHSSTAHTHTVAQATKARKPPKITQPRVPPPKERKNHASILIVDDDYVNRLVLSNILQVDGYEVIEASNGMEALETLNKNSDIDLIIMDIMMPVMSGPDACLEIRKTVPKERLPILFLTAKNLDSETSETDSYIKLGANGVLSKPLDKEVLRKALQVNLAHTQDHASTYNKNE